MASAANPLLMTVEEYRQLPDKPDVIQELHWGHVLTLSRPKPLHIKLQSRITRLLCPIAEHLGYVESELPFRALPDYDLRAADVAFVTRERWDAVSEDHLAGSPELVIEISSPSNIRAEIPAMAALCLATGTGEFGSWTANARS